MRKTRQSISRRPNKIIRIFCEGGKSEPAYFNGIFNNEAKNRKLYSFKVTCPQDHSPFGLVNAAKLEKQNLISERIPPEDIIIWVVFDRNGHNRIPEAFDMASANNIDVAFSSICFEFWILLHYAQTMRPFTKCDELIHFIKQQYDSDYEKCDNHFEKLKNKINVALKNGEWCQNQVKSDIENGVKIYELNPYTNVHKLVSYLLRL